MAQSSPESSVTSHKLGQQAAFLEQQADVLFSAGDLWGAEALMTRAAPIWSRSGNLAREAQNAHTTGFLRYKLSRHQDAIETYVQAQRIRLELQDFVGWATSACRCAEVYQHLGDHRNAIRLLNCAVPYWEKSGKTKELGTTFNNIGVSYTALGLTAVASSYHEKALALRRRIGDQNGLAVSLHNLGALLLEKKDSEAAFSCLRQAAELYRAKQARGALGRVLLHIGIWHEQAGDTEEALLCYEQAWEHATAPDVDNPADEAAALNNLGALEAATGDTARGMRLLEQARRIFRQLGKTEGLASASYHYGVAQCKLGATREAASALREAEQLYKKTGDQASEAAALIAIANIASQRGLQPLAYDLLMQAGKLQKAMPDRQSYARTQQLLAGICELQGREEQADHFRRLASV